MKKLGIMILLIIVSFSFFLMSYNKRRDYSLNYKVKEFDIKEKYLKNDEKYYVEIKYKNKKYFYIINENYKRRRKLVSNIRYVKNNDEGCLLIKFNNKKQTPSCVKNNEYISYQLVSDKLKTKIGKSYYKEYKDKINKTYNNIEINTLYNKKILVWNYHGFYILDNDKNHEIKIFDNDTYNVSLIGQIDNYLLIPNYDQTYEYETIKVLNTKDLKIKKYHLNDNLSSDSYVMGTNGDSIFYYDTKYHKEYEFVPYKMKYREVNNYIYEKGKQVDKSEIYLSNHEVKFTYDTLYSYKLISNKLYRYNKYNSLKELITDLSVKDIVKEDNSDIYFISGESLYLYNDKYGVIKLLDYFELNFNYKNIFYIF